MKKNSSFLQALKIVTVYLSLGTLWILSSDKILLFFAGKSDIYFLLQTVKGWFYVIFTGIVLLFLFYRELKNKEKLLRERDILNSELDHRIKNNLQIVQSLIHLRLCKKDILPETQHVLQSLYSQLESISNVHLQLYTSTEISDISIDEYLDTLTKGLSEMYKFKEKNIEIRRNLNELTLSLDKVIPLGMILNELISNCANHAFVERDNGIIEITTDIIQNTFTATVRDNGNGFDASLVDINPKTHLGIHLINALTLQLCGNCNYSQQDGTKVSIEFPVDNHVA